MGTPWALYMALPGLAWLMASVAFVGLVGFRVWGIGFRV